MLAHKFSTYALTPLLPNPENLLFGYSYILIDILHITINRPQNTYSTEFTFETFDAFMPRLAIWRICLSRDFRDDVQFDNNGEIKANCQVSGIYQIAFLQDIA